jgi:hypothetical protein
MRLYVGKRVRTKSGPGRVVEIRNAVDTVPGHGKAIRGLAYAVVELDRGGRRACPALELREGDE